MIHDGQPEHPETVTDAPQAGTSQRSRRVRAILAGGLVLGLGAAVTLAAWNGSQFAEQTFSSGQFTFSSSVDGTTFEDHDTANRATLTAPAAGLTDMAPGETHYLSFWLQLDSSEDATITQTAPTFAADALDETFDADDLTISSTVVTRGAGNETDACTAADFQGSPASAASFSMPAESTRLVCIRVVTGAQGTFEPSASADLTWQFDAATS